MPHIHALLLDGVYTRDAAFHPSLLPTLHMTELVAMHDARWRGGPFIVGFQHPPGTFTDDTQMSMAVAEALIVAGRADLDTLMSAMGQRFVAWSESDDNNRAPGSSCMTGCAHLKAGMPWRQAGVADSKACGSAMRVAPIGLYHAGDERRVVEVARASSLLTHGHDAGVEGAAAAALLVSLALQARKTSTKRSCSSARTVPRISGAAWKRCHSLWSARPRKRCPSKDWVKRGLPRKPWPARSTACGSSGMPTVLASLPR